MQDPNAQPRYMSLWASVLLALFLVVSLAAYTAIAVVK